MFTTEQREHVRKRVLELAQSDPRIMAGALTGSTAFGEGDAWSDVDIAFGITNEIPPEEVLRDWQQLFDQEFGVLDHFDLHAGSSVYRVFLLASGLELDVGVTPEKDFGARGPFFHALFGTPRQLEPAPPPDASHLIGLCWHHVYHARACIERNKPWQAEYWLSEIRNHIFELMCIRLGESVSYRRGVDQLPSAVTHPLTETLVRSLAEAELRRALAVTTRHLLDEIEQWDSRLCARLTPRLQEFAAL